MFDYTNDPFAQGARKYRQELISKAFRRLKHKLARCENERHYYKNKSEEQAKQMHELKERIAILEALVELLQLKIKEK